MSIEHSPARQRETVTATNVKDSVLDGYLTATELATELNVSPRTIARWRGLREGPPLVRVGRRIMYRRSSVAAWLAELERNLVAS